MGAGDQCIQYPVWAKATDMACGCAGRMCNCYRTWLDILAPRIAYAANNCAATSLKKSGQKLFTEYSF
jgi:hypothetical protein